MAFIHSEEDRRFFEEFLAEHPVREDYDPTLFDDKKDNLAYKFEQSCAIMTKALLEGKL